MAFTFSCSYWVKLRLIKIQQTLTEATVVVDFCFVFNVVVMALLVVTDPIVNICGQ